MKKMKSTPVVGKTVKRSVVMKLASQDKRKHTSHYKREPKSATEAVVAKYTMIGGVPHKAVNGVLVPLTKKA
jgi:hypothetical protein